MKKPTAVLFSFCVLVSVRIVLGQIQSNQFESKFDSIVRDANLISAKGGTSNKGCSESESTDIKKKSFRLSPLVPSEIIFQRKTVAKNSKTYYTSEVSLTLSKTALAKEKSASELITVLITNKWQGEIDEGFDSIVRRYLVRERKLTRIRSLSIGADRGALSKLENLAEEKLQQTYGVSKIDETESDAAAPFPPPCEIAFAQASSLTSRWTFAGVSFEKGEYNVNGKDGVFSLRKGDPVFYIESDSSVFYTYLPKQPFSFQRGSNSYVCFSDPGKREQSSDQQRHILVAGLERSQLHKIDDLVGIGSIYELKNDPAVEAYFKTVLQSFDFGPNEKRGNKPTKSDYLKSFPIVYIADPLNRIYRCRAKNLEFDYSQFVEPLIYLYTDSVNKTQISLGSDVVISSSEPAHENNSWIVTATPLGLLTIDGSQRFFSSIFWEGRSSLFPKPPSQGQIVIPSQLNSFFNEHLSGFGLNQREISDFKRYWIPKLQNNAAVLVDFLLNEEVAPFVSLKTHPDMKSIRVYLLYWPIDSTSKSFRPKIFPKLHRPNGNLIVEWGGVDWSKDELQ